MNHTRDDGAKPPPDFRQPSVGHRKLTKPGRAKLLNGIDGVSSRPVRRIAHGPTEVEVLFRLSIAVLVEIGLRACLHDFAPAWCALPARLAKWKS